MWPTAEESDLAGEVRRLLDRTCPREQIRAGAGRHGLGWKSLAGQLGAAGLAVPESAGGAGADAAALAVVAEEIGRAAAAVPFLSTVLAVDLLVRAEESDVLPALADGRLTGAPAFALDRPDPAAVHAEFGNGATLTGVVPRVLDGAAADVLIVVAAGEQGPGLFLVRSDAPGLSRTSLRTLDLGRPQDRLEFDGTPAQPLRVPDVAEALRGTRRLALLLLAAEQCGVAAWSLATAVEHARTREQFGVPIGSFQAVKHLCADLFARTELARALVSGAVDAMRGDPDRDRPVAADVAVEAALVGASEAALAVTAGAVQVLGGIGFTWEHDVHLYFRRARADAVLAGTLTAHKDDLAEHLTARHFAVEPASAVKGELAHYAARAAAWFADNVPRRVTARATEAERHLAAAREFRAALAAAGYAGITVPPQYGGQGLGVEHELAVAHAARGRETYQDVFAIGTGMCLPVLLALGTEEQKTRHIAPLLRGEAIWCQLFSEPGAGSDVASLRTRAVRDGDEWVINGQKVWTTYAQHAAFGLLLARTNPAVPKHKGLTMFVVDMRTAGITARPLRQITGDCEFNEVFLDDVRLPADAVVGTVDQGWHAATVMLMNERVTIGRDPLAMSSPVTFGRLRSLVLDRGLAADPTVRQALADVFILERSLQLLGDHIGAGLHAGGDPGPFASVSKLGAAQLARLTAEAAFCVAGPGAAAWDEAQEGTDIWSYAVLFAPALGIAGGTDQIQRTIIAERLLGLPKA